MNSRTGESILMNGNIADFLALNHEDYLNKAIFYSNNLDRLDQVRNDIFNNVLKTSLFNSENFSNDIKNSLLNIYNRDN
jgi:predicted O-linked N-acetylglucosamine transferase (SPINDLY family)